MGPAAPQRRPVVIETLYGVKILDLAAGERASLGVRFYGMNFLIVCLHVLLLCLLPHFMVFRLIEMQLVFSVTTDPALGRVGGSAFDSPRKVFDAAMYQSTPPPLSVDLVNAAACFFLVSAAREAARTCDSPTDMTSGVDAPI